MFFRFLAFVIGMFFLSPLQSQLTISQFAIEPNDGNSIVLSNIQSSQETIDLVIYEFTDPDIISALISARQRGVYVRVSFNYYGTNYVNDPTYYTLRDAGIDVQYANPYIYGYNVTHQKTFIFDGSTGHGTALVMSLNLEQNYFTGTRDAAVLVTSPSDVQEILDVFNADWYNNYIVPTQPDLVWSPNNSSTKLLNLINNATSTLEVYNEEMDYYDIQNALIAAVQRGVNVRVILSPPTNPNLFGQIYPFSSFSNGPGLQMINQGGVQVRLIAVPYIHCKMIIADFNTDHLQAFLGSENFSAASLFYNRELGVLLNSSQSEQVDFITQLKAAFEFDWNVVKGL